MGRLFPAYTAQVSRDLARFDFDFNMYGYRGEWRMVDYEEAYAKSG